MVYVVPSFFTFFCFLLVIMLFKMAPKNNAEGLSCVPKFKKAVMLFFLQRKDVLMSFIQAQATVLLAMSSVLMKAIYTQ